MLVRLITSVSLLGLVMGSDGNVLLTVIDEVMGVATCEGGGVLKERLRKLVTHPYCNRVDFRLSQNSCPPPTVPSQSSTKKFDQLKLRRSYVYYDTTRILIDFLHFFR